jgi:hypothetical protein
MSAQSFRRIARINSISTGTINSAGPPGFRRSSSIPTRPSSSRCRKRACRASEQTANRKISCYRFSLFTLSACAPLMSRAPAIASFFRILLAVNPCGDVDLGISRANAAAYPGLGMIRFGPPSTGALIIGNAGTSVDSALSFTFADTLSMSRGKHEIRTGAGAVRSRFRTSTVF